MTVKSPKFDDPAARPLPAELLALAKIAAPAVMAQIAQMSLGLIDTIMAGQYSPEALAAIAVGTNLLMPVTVTMMGLFLALNPIVAHLNGRGEFAGIGRVFQMGMMLALVFALPTFYLLRNFTPLMIWLGIEPSIIPLVDGYLEAVSWGSAFFYLFFALRAGNEGLFATKAVMVCSLLAIPFNILFNYWFIHGGLGLPAMGAVGVGYATSLVWSLLFAFLLLFTLRNPAYASLAIFARWRRPRWALIKEVLHIGVPLGLGLGMEVIMFALVGLLIGTYTIEVIAGHQIAMNIASMTFMVPLGISIGITARVGFAMGRGSLDAVRRSGFAGIGVAALFQILSATLMISLPAWLAGFYTGDTAVINIAVQLLFYAAVFQFSDGIQVASGGALRGMKDTRVPMLINMVAYWVVGFPIGYYLAEISGLGARGYWIGLIAALSTSAVLLFTRFYRKSRNRQEIAGLAATPDST